MMTSYIYLMHPKSRTLLQGKSVINTLSIDYYDRGLIIKIARHSYEVHSENEDNGDVHYKMSRRTAYISVSKVD